MGARNAALEALVQEATTRPLADAPQDIKRIDLREAGGSAWLLARYCLLLALLPPACC